MEVRLLPTGPVRKMGRVPKWLRYMDLANDDYERPLAACGRVAEPNPMVQYWPPPTPFDGEATMMLVTRADGSAAPAD